MPFDGVLFATLHLASSAVLKIELVELKVKSVRVESESGGSMHCAALSVRAHQAALATGAGGGDGHLLIQWYWASYGLAILPGWGSE